MTAKSHVLTIGCGFIGGHVARWVHEAGRRSVVVTRTPPLGLPADIDVRVGDAGDAATLRPALDGVDHVVYCAGGLLPPAAQESPLDDARLSLGPLVTLLEILRERPGVGVTFFSSGGTVYGNPARLPVDERHPTQPISAYGVNKVASENYLRMYGSMYGIPVRILRCANVYGERQPERPQGIVAAFLHRLLRGAPLGVIGDGSTVRDYLYVGDLRDLVLAPPGSGETILNVGSGVGTSITELIALAAEVSGREPRVERLPARPFDVRAIVLDTTRLRSVAAFRPTPLRDGLRRTWSHLLEAVAVCP